VNDAERYAKILPSLCKGDIDGPSFGLKAEGHAITDERRNELLAKVKAGEHVVLTLTVLAFEQRPGKPNRNFVRFADKAMAKLATSGVGAPFLRNHDQQDIGAKGGVITESTLVERGPSDYAISQTVELSAPWAVELALRNLLDGVSIGWWPSGPVECSVCAAAIGTKCYHWPGDRVSLVRGDDGDEKYVRDAKGKLFVEWVFTAATLIETSAVNVPAVPNAGIERIRASLSAAFPGDVDGDGLIAPPTPHHADDPTRTHSASQRLAAAQEPRMDPKSAPTNEETTLAAKAESDKAFQAAVDAETEKRLSARRADERVISDMPSVKRLGLDVGKLLDEHKTVDKTKLAILGMLEAQQAPATLGAHGVEVGKEHGEKRREVYESAILAKLSGKRTGLSNEANKLADRSLLSVAKSLMLEAGWKHSDMLDLDDTLVAKLALGVPLDIGARRSILAAGPGMNSSSDFSSIIGSVFNQRMRALYTERQQIWKVFATKENLDSFDKIPSYMGGRWPDLLEVGEGGTVQRGSATLTSEEIKLAKAARIVSLTLELILRDRIGFLDRIISDRANAALRWEDSLFYARLLLNSGNSYLGLGTNPFFVSDNTATGGQNVASLISAMTKMATRTTRPGDPVVGPDEPANQVIIASNVTPRYIHAPESAATLWEQILGTGYVPTAATGAVTERLRRLVVVPDANLDANGITASFAYAEPGMAPTWQWGNLNEWNGPVLFEQDGFEVMGKDYLVAHAAYVMPIENVGAVKIPAT
jgi:hypothetical protein